MAKKRLTKKSSKQVARKRPRSNGEGSVFDRARERAFQALSFSQRATTNLFVHSKLYAAGELIGPEHQRIKTKRPSVLVFADDEPLANFAHACRYMLFDSKSGELDSVVTAAFPPLLKGRDDTLQAFHEPVRFSAESQIFRPKIPFFPCLRRAIGKRYALLYAGMSNKRHLNDMEFLYRVLVDTYGYHPKDIYALSYDGTLNTQDGVQTVWPGDNTPYRIKITGNGTQASLDKALDAIKARIKRDDLLLIHTNNHGGYDGAPGTSYLCTYPSYGGYYAKDFAKKLGGLPAFRKLIVMMEQCNSGGFNAPVIAQSPADATSVASAAIETNSSYVSADGNWDPFARDWIAAQAGVDPFGAALAFDPDTNHDGKISAAEAFHYADVVKIPADTPNFSQSSGAGGAIALGEEYTQIPWWCYFIQEELAPWLRRIPPEELYARLHEAQPELEKLALALEQQSNALREQLAPQLKRLLGDALR